MWNVEFYLCYWHHCADNRTQISEPAEPPVPGACKKKKEFTRDGDEPFAGSLGGFKAA